MIATSGFLTALQCIKFVKVSSIKYHDTSIRQLLSQVIRSATPTAPPKLVHIRPRGASVEMG